MSTQGIALHKRMKPNPVPEGLEGLVGEAVEVRLDGGAVHRGEVVSVSREWLELERHTGGRALVRVPAVSAIVVDTLAQRAVSGRLAD